VKIRVFSLSGSMGTGANNPLAFAAKAPDHGLARFTPGDRYLHARAKVNYHWHKARWHASNASGFIPGDRCLCPSVKVKYHWRKARWHETKMPLGLSQGIVAFALA
jgi:hypothetical protein